MSGLLSEDSAEGQWNKELNIVQVARSDGPGIKTIQEEDIL